MTRLMSGFSIATIVVVAPLIAWQAASVDTLPPPSSLTELLTSVDCVVYASVSSVGTPRVDTVPGDSRFHTPSKSFVRRYHQLRVIETLKGDSKLCPTATATVRQSGGTLRTTDGDVETPYRMRLFDKGDVVLLALRRVSSAPPVFDVAFDDNGTVRQDSDGSAQLPQAWRAMPELANAQRIPMTDLLALVRRLTPIK